MAMTQRRFTACAALGVLVSVSGCGGNSAQQGYALNVEKGSYSNAFSKDTATVIKVRNGENRSVTIDRLMVNGTYQITKRWATTKPATCTFPLTLGAGESAEFFAAGQKGKDDPGSSFDPTGGMTLHPSLEKQRREREKKLREEREAKRREEEELWKGYDQPAQFVEVVTDRGTQKFTFK